MTASQWHHIGGEEYTADICSRRAATVHELSNETGPSKSWYKGPNFLWSNSKVEGTLKRSKIEDLDENNEEIKRKCCFTNNICKVKPFIKFGIHSSSKRLCPILSYVKRFIKKLQNKRKQFGRGISYTQNQRCATGFNKTNPTGKFCRKP